MDTEKENNIRLLLQAQLQQEFGKQEGPSWTAVFLLCSVMVNVFMGYGWYTAYARIQECAEAVTRGL